MSEEYPEASAEERLAIAKYFVSACPINEVKMQLQGRFLISSFSMNE